MIIFLRKKFNRKFTKLFTIQFLPFSSFYCIFTSYLINGNPNMFEQTFKNIDDILLKDAGCSSELDYVEQTSWIQFLKYIDDLFDVLEYISFSVKPMSREERVAKAQPFIFSGVDNNQKEILEFVLSKYIETGVEELFDDKLPDLLKIKYLSLNDAKEILGEPAAIRNTFIKFQKHLYSATAD